MNVLTEVKMVIVRKTKKSWYRSWMDFFLKLRSTIVAEWIFMKK